MKQHLQRRLIMDNSTKIASVKNHVVNVISGIDEMREDIIDRSVGPNEVVDFLSSQRTKLQMILGEIASIEMIDDGK
jgi:hypothetical protein